eukprot:gene13479-3939_t
MITILSILALLSAMVEGLDNGAGLTPPMGWSTWCSGGICENDYCSEEMVKTALTRLFMIINSDQIHDGASSSDHIHDGASSSDHLQSSANSA